MSATTTATVVSITPYIDANGIHIPEFADVLTFYQQQYLSIFGADSYIADDSQDGQLIGVQAKGYYDVCTFAVAVFNSFGPNNALGVGLSNLVLLNGIQREPAVNSQAPLLISGTPGVTFNNAYATDINNNQWNIPNGLEIPPSGNVNTIGTCNVAGAITAAPNTITGIGVNILGWNGVTNPEAATLGNAGENDAQLRIRQQISTAQPSITPLEGIAGAVAAIPGVTRVMPWENDTNLTDSHGIPPFNISLVIDGGDPTLIAQTIANKKTLGSPTYGNTSVTVTNTYGNPQTINFNRSVQIEIVGKVTIKPFTGYTTAIASQIVNALVSYIAAIPVGGLISITKLYVPANLPGTNSAAYFEIVLGTLLIGTTSIAPAANDIQLTYNEEAFSQISDWTVTVQGAAT